MKEDRSNFLTASQIIKNRFRFLLSSVNSLYFSSIKKKQIQTNKGEAYIITKIVFFYTNLCFISDWFLVAFFSL